MARRFTTARHVREELELRLGYEPNRQVWEDLDKDGYVRDVTVAGWPIKELLDKYKEKEGRFDRKPPIVPGIRLERGQDPETELLSKLVAAEAAADPEVVAFRTAFLRGQLLLWSDVPEWLESTAEDEGPPGGFFTAVRYSGDIEVEYQTTGERVGVYPTIPICVSQTNPAEGTHRVALAFAKEGDSAVSRMIVNPGGTLDKLHRLSEHLSELHNWQPAQATVFVLTGIPPAYSRAAVTFRYVGTKERLVPRLTFTLDPSLPAAEVLRIYRSARRELMAPVGGPSRRRPVEEKSLRLADFAASLPSGTWEERMAAWNRTHSTARPEWAYDNRRNFQRDVARAVERMKRQGVVAKSGGSAGGKR